MTELATRARLHLRKFVGAVRPDWHDAGIDAALVKLSQHITDPFTVARIALDTAADARNRTPAAMNHQPTPTTPTSRPRNIGACPTHGGTSRRGPDGEWACCYIERITERPTAETTERQTTRTTKETA